NPLVVVTLRDPGLAAGLATGAGGQTRHTLQTFVDLHQAIAASLELDTTIQTILENIEKLVPADWMELAVRSGDSEALAPYRLYGVESGARRLEAAPERYRPGENLAGLVAQERKPLLISDVSVQKLPFQPTNEQEPLRSLLAVPLLLGKDLIGTLALGSLTPG